VPAGLLGPILGGMPLLAQELHFTDTTGQPLEQVLRRITLSASARIRPEYDRNFSDFSNRSDDEVDFVSARFRFGLGADLPLNTGLFLEIQNASFWGEDSRFLTGGSTGEDALAMYQGYGEARDIGKTGLGTRVGRQELRYGTEMLLGAQEFDAGLSHDAIKVTYDANPSSPDTGIVSVHGFWAREVERHRGDGSPIGITSNDEDVDFLGLYSAFRLPWENTGFDAYWLYLRNGGNLVNTLPPNAPDDRRHTLGARASLAAFEGILSLNGEVAWQLGTSGASDDEIRALAAEASAAIDLKQAPFHPGLTAGYSFATGDGDPSDGVDERFNPLFENNHARLGLSDVFFLENIEAANVVGSFSPFWAHAVKDRVRFGSGYHAFWAPEPADTVAPRAFAGRPPASHRFIGQEVDVFIDLRYTQQALVQLAWAHLIPASYIEDRFLDEDEADRVYLHLLIGF
jgi:Alginate export